MGKEWATYVEDFKSGDIEYSNEVVTRGTLLVKGQVTLLHNPVEDASVQTLGDGSDGPVDLFDVLSLGDPLGSDLDSGGDEGLQELIDINSVHGAGSLGVLLAIGLGLFFTRALLELHGSRVKMGSHQSVAVHLLLGREVQDIEGLVRQLELFGVVDSVNYQLSLSHEPVLADGFVQQKLLFKLGLEVGEDLVEDVVATLSGSLTDDTRFLKKI